MCVSVLSVCLPCIAACCSQRSKEGLSLLRPWCGCSTRHPSSSSSYLLCLLTAATRKFKVTFPSHLLFLRAVLLQLFLLSESVREGCVSGCVVCCGLPPGHYYIFPGTRLTGSCDLFPSDDGQREAPNNGGRGRRGTHCDHSGMEFIIIFRTQR